MTRARIESLLTSFPKLIPTNTQHTSVETAEVRYVYQPLEELYILLITNKASNILQDIETLHLIARVVSDMCRNAEEREILKNAFDLLGAFDEIVSLGYREQVSLAQVRSVLEMESHEEKIQEIIARVRSPFSAQAYQGLSRHCTLEQRSRGQGRAQEEGQAARDATARTATACSFGYGGRRRKFPGRRRDWLCPGTPAIRGSHSSADGLPPTLISPHSRFQEWRHEARQQEDKTSRTSRCSWWGACRGGTVRPRFADSRPGTRRSSKRLYQHPPYRRAGKVSIHSVFPMVIPDPRPQSVHVSIKESVSVDLMREGGVNSLEVKGDMNLHVSDDALTRIRLSVAPPPSSVGAEVQFKQHPNVVKFQAQKERVVVLKDPGRGFPVNQPLGVLKWRYSGKDETYVPLSSTSLLYLYRFF